MMKITKRVFFCFLIGIAWLYCNLSMFASAAEVADLDEKRTAQIQAAVEAVMQKQKLPGISVAVGMNNQLVYSAGFGLSDVENQVPATGETVYRTASIAKTMTAIAAMQLVEQGKLDLDAPIDSYFDKFPKKRWPITARQLLGHLAGVRHYKRTDEATSTKHFASVSAGLSTFTGDPLLHKPGTKFRYTSFGYNLLGAILEDRSGSDFVPLLEKNIWEPAHMTSTTEDNHYTVIPNRSRGYLRINAGILAHIPSATRKELKQGQLINAQLHDTSMKIPGGGLVSTAPDLVRLAMTLNRGELLKQETLDQMWTRQQPTSGGPSKYGLGFSIIQSPENGKPKIVGHSGSQAGVSTYMMLCPKQKTSVAIMSNLQNTSLKKLGLRILAMLNSETETVATTSTLTEYDEIAKRLTEFCERELEQKDIPAVSIAVVDGDQIVWSAGFGKQDAKGETPASSKTVYRAGSVSKLFTDMAVMQLVDQGKLDLDADIQTVLPNFKPRNKYGIPLTLRMLMSHQSGLVRESPVGNYFDASAPTLQATVESCNTTDLVYKPGTRTKYSNAAIAAVGYAVQKTVGKPFEDTIQEAMLDPMQMRSSSFTHTPTIDANLAEAQMRTHHNDRFSAIDFPLGTAPAGNLYSTVDDLGHFLITVLNEGKFKGKQIVKPSVLKSMLAPIPTNDNSGHTYGIGFRLDTLDGHKTFGHGGAVYGFSTQVLGLPDEKIGVAAVASLDGANGFVTRLCNYAMRLLLAQKAGKPLPSLEASMPVDITMARKLTGTYSDGNEIIEILQHNQQPYSNQLFVKRGYTMRELRLKSPVVDEFTNQLTIDDTSGFGPSFTFVRDGSQIVVDGKTFKRIEDSLPEACPDRWLGLIGEYGEDHNTLFIYEDRGQLWAMIEWFYYYPLKEVSENVFAFPNAGLYHGEQLIFARDGNSSATEVEAAKVVFKRRPGGQFDGTTFKIRPTLPIETLRTTAMQSTPPRLPRNYKPTDLVDLTSLDPTIHLDIRYASSNNFMGTPFYKSARAFMQRPAAEALVRVHASLKPKGFGLLIHDAYRPWFVTKMFWDGTPEQYKIFVADPEKGSTHNRGCAVDLSLFDLKTGKPIEMVAGFDEFTHRAFAYHPGGTSRQRWHRRLLRQAMEQEDYNVYRKEWWHFNHKSRRHFDLNNSTFEELGK